MLYVHLKCNLSPVALEPKHRMSEIEVFKYKQIEIGSQINLFEIFFDKHNDIYWNIDIPLLQLRVF